MNPQEFLDRLFPLRRGYIEFRLIHVCGRIKQIFVPIGINYRGVLREVRRYNEKHYNAYFGVCARSRKSGTSKDILYTGCLWVDVDKDLDYWRKYHPRPSIVINSGHGKHLYWVLDKIFDLTKPQNCVTLLSRLKKLCTLVHGDIAATDLARVLRVPNTINWNPPKK